MSEQICENCGKANPENEAYCFSCGHILPTGLAAIATSALPDSTLKAQLRWGTAYFGEESLLRVHVRDVDQVFEVIFHDQLVMGRAVDDVVPDVDLTPYNAQDLGVSRRHAKLSRDSETIMVQDLGSINGTFLNGQKLLPYQPRVLRDDDDLVLGRLALAVSFHRVQRPPAESI